MAKQKIVPRAPSDTEFPSRRTSWVVRVGIAIVGVAVAASSLLPILSYFERAPAQAPEPDSSAAKRSELEAAAKAYPKNASLQVLLGNAYFDQKAYGSAASAYERALALAPGDPDVMVDDGTARYYSGHPHEAIAAYQDVIARHPEHFKAHLDLGVVEAAVGDVAMAKKAWTEALALAPDANAKQEIGTMLAGLALSAKKR